MIEIDGSPFFSNGQIGEHAIPLNFTAMGDYVNNRLAGQISDLAQRRFRNSATTLGTLMTVVLNHIMSLAVDCYYTHTSAISRIRTMIPNELANALDYTGGTYDINAYDIASYMCTLSKWNISGDFMTVVDSMAEVRLSQYSDLAKDINAAVYLARQIVGMVRPKQTKALGYVQGIMKLLDRVNPTKLNVSETLSVLLSESAVIGKAGYKEFLKNICNMANIPESSTPIHRIQDRVADLITREMSSFGITDEVLIYPSSIEVETDIRFKNIFRRCPFVASMPLGFKRVHYNVFTNMPTIEAAMLINKTGVILHGVPFRFRYQFKGANENTVLRSGNEFLKLRKDGMYISDIEWTIGFDDGPDLIADTAGMLELNYKAAIVTPNNFKPVDEYQSYNVEYVSLNSNNFFIDDHLYMYSNS
jgi:VP2 protein